MKVNTNLEIFLLIFTPNIIIICGICDNYCYYPREQVWTGAKEGTHNSKGCMDSVIATDNSTYVI